MLHNIYIFLTIWLSISCINLWPVWVCCNGISHFTWPSRDLLAAINFPLRLLLLLHTIYMNILPANLHIIIVNCVGPSLLQHAYPLASPFPLSLSLSFSLCVAFNQLLTLTSLARRSTRLFSLLSLAFYLRAPLSMSLRTSLPVLCLSWLPQWLSEPQSVTVSLSGWDFPLCCQSPLLRLCLPCGKANVKVDSALPAACCRCRGLWRHSAAISHCIRNGL